MARRTKYRITQEKRLRQLEQFLLLGLTHVEMAERLGVNEKTIRRDLKDRQESLKDQLEFETAAYRGAILGELGRIIMEAIKDGETARENNRQTDRYLDVRVDALRLVSRLTGAEMPAKALHLHAAVSSGVSNKTMLTNGPVQVIIEPNGGQFDPEWESKHEVKLARKPESDSDSAAVSVAE